MKASRLLALLCAILVLAGAYTAASWYAGREAQTRIEQFVEQVNLGLAAQWPVSEPQAVLRIEDYQRGWFSSNIQYQFVFQDEDGQPQHIAFQDALDHGPWPWAALREGDWHPAMAYSQLALSGGGLTAPWFDGVQGGGTPLTIRTRIGFDGHAHSVWQVRPARVQAEGVELTLGAGQLTVDYDADTRASTAQGSLDELSLLTLDTGERVHFQDLSLQSNSAFSGDSDMQAHYRAQVGQTTIQQPDAPVVGLKTLVVMLDAAQTGALADAQLRYTLDQVQMGAMDLGAFDLGMRAQQVNVAAFQALAQVWAEMTDDGDEPDGLTSAEQARLTEHLLPVLATGPSFLLEPLSWRNDKGRSQASASVAFQAPSPQAQAGTDPGVVLEDALRQARLTLEISRPMVIEAVRQSSPEDADRAAAMAGMMYDHFIGQFSRSGLIDLQKDVARLDLSYGAGQVVLNGRSMPVADFYALISPLLMSQ